MKKKRENESALAKKEKLIIGWREWVALPDLGVKRIKAKIDTGARTASLHAYDLALYSRGGKQFAKFRVNPHQKHARGRVFCRAEVVDHREVRSSNGMKETRPVIETSIHWNHIDWKIEVTLTNRDEMGFRMLLGRKSLKSNFLIDAKRSYFGEKKKKRKGK